MRRKLLILLTALFCLLLTACGAADNTGTTDTAAPSTARSSRRGAVSGVMARPSSKRALLPVMDVDGMAMPLLREAARAVPRHSYSHAAPI